MQRVADVLAREGLATYLPNPADRRAQLLKATDAGSKAVSAISAVQTPWADKLGAELGEERLTHLAVEIAAIREAVSATLLPGPAGRKPMRRSC